MLYLIGHNGAHRTIARLLGAYDVVVVDVPLERGKEGDRFAYSPVDHALRTLVQGVANTSGLNVVPFSPDDDGVSPDDGPMALHVLSGFHALDDAEADRVSGFMRHYSSIKQTSSQRLLVLTDSIFIRNEPYDWTADSKIAVVHVEGN